MMFVQPDSEYPNIHILLQEYSVNMVDLKQLSYMLFGKNIFQALLFSFVKLEQFHTLIGPSI